MADIHRDRTPTWAAFLAGALVMLVLTAMWFGWSRMQGAARKVDVRMGPTINDLPIPRLPEAPRIPSAPLPVPK